MSITGRPSNVCYGLPNLGNSLLRWSATDRRERQTAKALLGYLLDGEVDAKEIYDALGVSSSTYYRRVKEDNYPDAGQLRRVADRFALSYPDLQIRFG